MSEDTIINLNILVKTRIAPSTLHGVGVFAIRDIPKNTKLNLNLFPKAFKIAFSNISKLLPEVKEIILERNPNIVNGSAFFYPDANYQAYLNHSESNNYDGVLDLTLKDIKQGDEITENYRQITNYEKIYPWLST